MLLVMSIDLRCHDLDSSYAQDRSRIEYVHFTFWYLSFVYHAVRYPPQGFYTLIRVGRDEQKIDGHKTKAD
jgi:hypothetical protein